MYLDYIFGQKLYRLNDKHTIWCRTRKNFVFVPSENFKRMCTNDQIIVRSIRKRNFVRYFDHVYGALGNIQ